MGERLVATLKPLCQAETPFATVPAPARRGAFWVRPELVAEIRFAGWTEEERLRHASFQGLRDDKAASAVTRERPAAGPPAPATARGGRGTITVGGVRISSAGRVMIADPPITKGDLARYYAAVAPWILPEIAGRPLSIIRCPASIAEGCFYQRHRAPGMAKAVRQVDTVRGGEANEAYLAIDDLEGLLALVQFGAVDLHPWGCRADRPNRPDRLIFDLDPAEDVPWERVIEAAHELRGRLAALGLVSFAKTTGGKGLHLVVPIARRYGWDAVKEFAAGFATALADQQPRRFTATLAKAARSGRIFIDYLRNESGATAVAAYSVRSRPGGPVALPLAWEEVTPPLDPRAFTVLTVPALLATRADPWAGLSACRQALPRSAAPTSGRASPRRRRRGDRPVPPPQP